MNKIGITMLDGFDKDLMHRSETFDTMLHALGGSMPKKRLLQIDYKENGIDKHVSVAVYRHEPVADDKSLIQEIQNEYAKQGKKVSAIVEMDELGQPKAMLYVAPGFLEECMKETINILRNRKGNR